jgi:hypothetical protein
MPEAGRQPVNVTITVKPLDGRNKTLSASPDTIYLTATRGADWLQRVIVEIRPGQITLTVVPTDPHTPINKATVRPDGSATFTT